MKTILHTVKFNLLELFLKKSFSIIITLYALTVLLICLSDNIRYSYLNFVEQTPVLLIEYIVPVFIILMQLIVLTPVFSSDSENKCTEIPYTCLIGKKGLHISSVISSLLFSSICLLLFTIIACIISSLSGLFQEKALILYIEDTAINPMWTVSQHIWFSLLSLFIASNISSTIILFISFNAKTTVSAIGIISFILAFEFIFNFFAFPVLLKEFNIFVLFRPYFFFHMQMLKFNPLQNLLALSALMMPICIFLIFKIINN